MPIYLTITWRCFLLSLRLLRFRLSIGEDERSLGFDNDDDIFKALMAVDDLSEDMGF